MSRLANAAHQILQTVLHRSNRLQQTARFVKNPDLHLRRQITHGDPLGHHHCPRDGGGHTHGDSPGNHAPQNEGKNNQHRLHHKCLALQLLRAGTRRLGLRSLQLNQLVRFGPQHQLGGAHPVHQAQDSRHGIPVLRLGQRAIDLREHLLGGLGDVRHERGLLPCALTIGHQGRQFFLGLGKGHHGRLDQLHLRIQGLGIHVREQRHRSAANGQLADAAHQVVGQTRFQIVHLHNFLDALAHQTQGIGAGQGYR